MTYSRFFLAAIFSVLFAGVHIANAALVSPNPNTLSQVKQKRVLVIDDKFWNLYHEVPKQATLEILESIKTKIGFASFIVRDTAANITLEYLNDYDIVIFNYCDNLYKAVGTEFEAALKEWFATGNKGYMGYHTSGFYYAAPKSMDDWWTWYNDSVTSIRPIGDTKLNSAAHTNGNLIKTTDASLTHAPIFDGMDASFSASDVWLSLETEPGKAAPTWPDCKVLYYHDKDKMPQNWIREDDLRNRYFYSMQFHDSHAKGVASDFWHNLLLRALEYVAGERQTLISNSVKANNLTKGFSYLTNSRQLKVDLDGNYRLSVLTPAGKRLYFSEGKGKKTFSPSVLKMTGSYIVQLEFKGEIDSQRILVY